MNEEKLIYLMLEHGFSEGQINKIKKLSKKNSMTLCDAIKKLGSIFYRSLIMHILIFTTLVYSYYHDSKQHYYSSWSILMYVSILCFIYFTFNAFAPLFLAYKAKKFSEVIKKN
jgi:hypothetical protein